MAGDMTGEEEAVMDEEQAMVVGVVVIDVEVRLITVRLDE